MNVEIAFANEIRRQVAQSRTSTSQGKVVSVNGGEVSFTIGGYPTPMKGRWVGATAPIVGETITWLNDGSGYPIVFGSTGKESLGTLYEWAPYTVDWTAVSGAPSIGNGNLAGRVTRASQWVMVEIHLKAGASTGFGVGEMRFSLPYLSANNGDFHQVEGHVHRPGLGFLPLTGLIPAATNYVTPMFHQVHSTAFYTFLSSLTATNPNTLDDADAIFLRGIYRTV